MSEAQMEQHVSHCLKVRSIDFDLKQSLANRPIPEWIEDRGIAYLAIGYSFALEYTEHAINQANPAISAALGSSELRQLGNIFNFQEANHAKHHKVLNEMLLPGRATSEKYHPRVYDFLYANYKAIREPLIRRLNEPRNKEEQRQAVGEAIFRIAAFETVTCSIGLTFFEFFFHDGRFEATLRACSNPAVLYLFGYHLAEELEHCTTAMEIYKALFGNPVWTEASITQAMPLGQNPTEVEAYAAAFEVSKFLGADLRIEELRDNSFAAAERQKRSELLVPGFDPGQGRCAEERQFFVGQWDREWEPRLREVIERG